MARLESVAVAGYFPTPDALVPRIAARIDASAGQEARYDAQLRMTVYPTYALLDPAAGDGAALVACAQTLFGDPLPTLGQGPQIHLYGVELEADRAQALAGRVRAATPGYGRGVALHSDAFQVTWAIGPGAAGAQLLWLNPPYDQDEIHGRLEQAFLLRWTPALTPGTGLLVFMSLATPSPLARQHSPPSTTSCAVIAFLTRSSLPSARSSCWGVAAPHRLPCPGPPTA